MVLGEALQRWAACLGLNSTGACALVAGDGWMGYPPKPGHPIVSITYRKSLLALPRPGQLINLC